MTQSPENGDGLLQVAHFRRLGRLNQAVRHAAHGRHDCRHGALPRRFLHDLRGAPDAARIAHRSPSEFHYLQWFLHLLRVWRYAI